MSNSVVGILVAEGVDQTPSKGFFIKTNRNFCSFSVSLSVNMLNNLKLQLDIELTY